MSISTGPAGCYRKQNTPCHIDRSFPLNPERRRITKVTICSSQPPQGRDPMTQGVGAGRGDMATRWRWEVVMGRLPLALTSPLQIYHLPAPPPPYPRDTPGVTSQTSPVLTVRRRRRRLVSSRHLTSGISLSLSGTGCKV